MSAGESPPDMRCSISHDLASFRGANRSASANAVKRCSFGMGMGQWRGLKVAFIAWCYVYTCFGCFPFFDSEVLEKLSDPGPAGKRVYVRIYLSILLPPLAESYMDAKFGGEDADMMEIVGGW